MRNDILHQKFHNIQENSSLSVLDAADTISAKIFGIVLYFDINIINVQFKKMVIFTYIH